MWETRGGRGGEGKAEGGGRRRRDRRMSSSSSSKLGREVVKTVDIQGRGRGVVASESLKGGQVVLTDSPILLYSAHPLSSSSPPPYCSDCFRHLHSRSAQESNNLLISSCPSCPCLFCSPDCRSRALSSSHSPWVCSALSHLRASPTLSNSHSERHLQARFLVAAYNLALLSPSHFHLLLSLQGSALADSDSPAFLHPLLSSLCPPQGIPAFSLELTAALLAKDKLNAFGLMEPPALALAGQRSVRAYGIYPKASFFNHDCLPNACRFDYVDDTASHRNNTDITIRLIHDVPQGREICLSYFPVNETYADRQKRLLEDYGFACDCDRCRVEANWKDDDDDDEAQLMDEDHDEQMIGSENEIEVGDGGGEGDNDFPHAYFFLRYMCSRENCWGTLAPLPPSDSDSSPSNIMECNVCGDLKKADEDFNTDEDSLSVDD